MVEGRQRPGDRRDFDLHVSVARRECLRRQSQRIILRDQFCLRRHRLRASCEVVVDHFFGVVAHRVHRRFTLGKLSRGVRARDRALPHVGPDLAHVAPTRQLNHECRFLLCFLILRAIFFASDLSRAPHARSDSASLVGSPFGFFIGPLLPAMRARNLHLRGLFPLFTGALRWPG